MTQAVCLILNNRGYLYLRNDRQINLFAILIALNDKTLLNIKSFMEAILKLVSNKKMANTVLLLALICQVQYQVVV